MTEYNQEGLGVKQDQGKLQWSLLPLEYLEGCVRVLMVGAKKYAPHNWRKGMPYTQPYNALQRHLQEFMKGQDIDPESGEHVLDHALCELLFLRMNTMERKDLDDRFRKVVAAVEATPNE
jgi:hypothetical protein